MTTTQELDKKIKYLQAQLNFNKRQPIQQTQLAQPEQQFTVKPQTPEELRTVIAELIEQTQKRIVKPKTPQELSVKINDLLNTI